MLLALVPVIAISACGQKLDASKVPAAVKAAFAAKYAGLSVKWEMEDGKYEANFKQDNNTMSAMFKPDGTFTESETDIKVTELPAGVLLYLKQHYTGKAIKEAAKITKADGTVNYEAEVSGKDLIFDANSKFIKAVKD